MEEKRNCSHVIANRSITSQSVISNYIFIKSMKKQELDHSEAVSSLQNIYLKNNGGELI